MIWEVLDKWGHRFKLPKFIQNYLCDQLDLYLGMPRELIEKERAERRGK